MRLTIAILLAGCVEKPTSAETPRGCNECATEEALDVPDCAQTVGESFPCEGHCHVEDAADAVWHNDPPHSGSHLPVWEQEWGEHTEAIARANWVHNLEHGWIVLLYDCETACDAELDVLRQVLAERPDTPLLLTPDPLLDPPRFAAVAWTWVYETDAPDLATLLCFVDQHACQAPEGSLYGAECLF
jgi:hypothetical protein